MRLKSFTIKEYFKNNNLDINNLPQSIDLIIDGIGIQKRYYKEEIKHIKEDLKKLADKNITNITLKNIKIEECAEMDYIMKNIGKTSKTIGIYNCTIGNLDLYMSSISGRCGKNYSLSETQHIKEFEYDVKNEMLVIAAKNLDILSEIVRYKKPKTLRIKIYSKEDLQTLLKYIDYIREMKFPNYILENNSKESRGEIYKYESYINEKIILLQSELIKESIGLDRLLTKKSNKTIYNLKIDGSKVNKNCIYVLEGEQIELFVKDMRNIAKYVNIAKIEYKNVVFPDVYDVKEVITRVKENLINKELIEENCIVVKRSIFSILKDKICSLFKKQLALPIYTEKM